MFRMVVIVDDKQLAPALHVLAGKVINIETPQPITNAKVGRGGALIAETSGTLSDMFLAHVRKHRMTQCGAAECKAFLEGVGKSPASYSHTLQACVALGGLRRRKGKTAGGKGNKAVYDVVTQLALPAPSKR